MLWQTDEMRSNRPRGRRTRCARACGSSSRASSTPARRWPAAGRQELPGCRVAAALRHLDRRRPGRQPERHARRAARRASQRARTLALRVYRDEVRELARADGRLATPLVDVDAALLASHRRATRRRCVGFREETGRAQRDGALPAQADGDLAAARQRARRPRRAAATATRRSCVADLEMIDRSPAARTPASASPTAGWPSCPARVEHVRAPRRAARRARPRRPGAPARRAAARDAGGRGATPRRATARQALDTLILSGTSGAGRRAGRRRAGRGGRLRRWRSCRCSRRSTTSQRAPADPRRAAGRRRAWRRRWSAAGAGMTVMVGYSDSAKDGGYLAAQWAIYDALSGLACGRGRARRRAHGLPRPRRLAPVAAAARRYQAILAQPRRAPARPHAHHGAGRDDLLQVRPARPGPPQPGAGARRRRCCRRSRRSWARRARPGAGELMDRGRAAGRARRSRDLVHREPAFPAVLPRASRRSTNSRCSRSARDPRGGPARSARTRRCGRSRGSSRGRRTAACCPPGTACGSGLARRRRPPGRPARAAPPVPRLAVLPLDRRERRDEPGQVEPLDRPPVSRPRAGRRRIATACAR